MFKIIFKSAFIVYNKIKKSLNKHVDLALFTFSTIEINNQ